jgi:hypothetical protein
MGNTFFIIHEHVCYKVKRTQNKKDDPDNYCDRRNKDLTRLFRGPFLEFGENMVVLKI